MLSSPPLAGYAKVSESHSPAAASVLALLNEEESFVIGCCLIYQARASARDSDAGRGSHRERTNYGRLWGGGQTHAHAIQPLGVAACNTDVRRGMKHERTRYSNRGAMFAPRAHKNTTGGRGGGLVYSNGASACNTDSERPLCSMGYPTRLLDPCEGSVTGTEGALVRRKTYRRCCVRCTTSLSASG